MTIHRPSCPGLWSSRCASSTFVAISTREFDFRCDTYRASSTLIATFRHLSRKTSNMAGARGPEHALPACPRSLGSTAIEVPEERISQMGPLAANLRSGYRNDLRPSTQNRTQPNPAHVKGGKLSTKPSTTSDDDFTPKPGAPRIRLRARPARSQSGIN